MGPTAIHFVSLFAVFILFAPTVHGCAIFQAYLSPTFFGEGTLIDDGVETCTLTDGVINSGMYTFTCNGGETLTFTPGATLADTGFATYGTDHGVYNFITPLFLDPNTGVSCWSACNYGCTDACPTTCP